MESPIQVLTTLRFTEAHLEQLRAVSPRLRIRQQSIRDDREDISPFLQGDEQVIYCMMPPRDLTKAPRLKWVQLHTAGIDHLLEQPIWNTDIVITTASGIHAVPIGEFAMGLLLALARKIPKLVRLQERADWPRRRWELLSGVELRGKTIGIIGYGSIGGEIARLAKQGFQMRVLAMRHSTAPPRLRYSEPGVGDPEGRLPERWFGREELDALLAASDVVVLSAPLTPATRGLIGAAQLRTMKPSAFLINVARGELVDEQALVQALKENRIAGAGLDAFCVEPLPRGSQLWHMENVIISPHIASATPQYDDRAVRLFAENLRRFLSGLPLLNVVAREDGY